MKKWGSYLAAVLLVLSVAAAYAVSTTQNFTISVTSVTTANNSMINPDNGVSGDNNVLDGSTLISGTGTIYDNINPPNAWTLVQTASETGTSVGCPSPYNTSEVMYRTALNGSITNQGAATSGVIGILWYNNVIYHVTCYNSTGANDWWSWNGTTWVTATGDPRSASSSTLLVQTGEPAAFTNALQGPLPQTACVGNPAVCNSSIVNTSMTAAGHSWTLTGTAVATTTFNANCPLTTGSVYNLSEDSSPVAGSAGVAGVLAWNNTVYQVTCNTFSGSNHLQWYKYNQTSNTFSATAVTDPRLLCNNDVGTGGGGEAPVTCKRLWSANSILNKPVASCSAGAGCYYPSGTNISGTTFGGADSSGLSTGYPEGPMFWQATTTDPVVAILPAASSLAYCVSTGDPSCPHPCTGATGVDFPNGNGATFDNCIRPTNGGATGTGGGTLARPEYQPGSIMMQYNTTAGFANQVTPTTQSGVSYRGQLNCGAPGSVVVGGVITPCNASPSYRMIYAPINAVRFNIANQGTDGHVQIVQPNGTIVDMNYTTKLDSAPGGGLCCHNGDYFVENYSVQDAINDMGDGYGSGSVSASMPESAGSITQTDVSNVANGSPINHGITMYCSTDACTTGSSGSSTIFQLYPAYTHDNGNGGCPFNVCATITSTAQPISVSSVNYWMMGTRFVISQAVFNAGPLGGGNWNTAAGKAIGQAFVTYGSFFVDRGSGTSHSISLHIDGNITDAGWQAGTSGLASDIQYIIGNMTSVGAAACAGASHSGTCPP